jgi:hypothetical protein
MIEDQELINNTGAVDIVPFGKYRGQPVEVLISDRAYSEWLMAQPWFRTRFVALFQLLMNPSAGNRLEETPEHNRLQMLWLDPVYQARVWKHINCGSASGGTLHFEVMGWDVHLQNVKCRNADGEECDDAVFFVELKPTLGDEFPAVLRQVKRYPLVVVDGRGTGPLYYRQTRQRFIFVERFTATSATLEQVQAMFRMDGIRLHELPPTL